MTQAVNYNVIDIARRNGAFYIPNVQMFSPEGMNFEQFVEDLVRECASFCSDPCDADAMLNYFGY